MARVSKSKAIELKPLARLFRTLADESRLYILELLRERGELSVSDLGRELDQSQPAISHHLAQLKNAKLIECRRDGKFNFYRLDPVGLQSHFDTLGDGSRIVFAALELALRR